MILVASFAWAVGSVYARVAPMPRKPVLSAAMQMLCAGLLLGVAGLAMGEGSRVHLGADLLGVARRVAFLIVFGSLVAFTAYAWLLKNASTTLLSTYAYVNPAVAVFLGWALVGEHVGSKEIAAGMVILSSVGLLVFGRAAGPSRSRPPSRSRRTFAARMPRSWSSRAPCRGSRICAGSRRNLEAISGATVVV